MFGNIEKMLSNGNPLGMPHEHFLSGAAVQTSRAGTTVFHFNSNELITGYSRCFMRTRRSNFCKFACFLAFRKAVSYIYAELFPIGRHRESLVPRRHDVIATEIFRIAKMRRIVLSANAISYRVDCRGDREYLLPSPQEN